MLPPTHVSTWRPLPKWFPLCGLIFLTPSFFFSSLHLLYPINLFILQDSDRTVPVAFLALPDLDLYCLILEHLPDFSVITSTPTSRPRPSLDQPHSMRLQNAGPPRQLSSWSRLRGLVPDIVRGGQRSPKATLLALGRGQFPVF